MAGQNLKKIPKDVIESMIRVNHAGEYGALRLYQGQMMVLGESSVKSDLLHMMEQEKKHLQAFQEMLQKHELTPTAFQPIWDKAAFFLGLGTALMGKNTAMACTVAVEEAIDEHYREQLDELKKDPSQSSLMDLIQNCHQEELDHHQLALEKGADQMAGYKPFKMAIKLVCKMAIELSKKI